MFLYFLQFLIYLFSFLLVISIFKTRLYIYLVLHFFCYILYVGFIFYYLQYEVITFMLILIYAGAVVILFTFVVMLFEDHKIMFTKSSFFFSFFVYLVSNLVFSFFFFRLYNSNNSVINPNDIDRFSDELKYEDVYGPYYYLPDRFKNGLINFADYYYSFIYDTPDFVFSKRNVMKVFDKAENLREDVVIFDLKNPLIFDHKCKFSFYCKEDMFFDQKMFDLIEKFDYNGPKIWKNSYLFYDDYMCKVFYKFEKIDVSVYDFGEIITWRPHIDYYLSDYGLLRNSYCTMESKILLPYYRQLYANYEYIVRDIYDPASHHYYTYNPIYSYYSDFFTKHETIQRQFHVEQGDIFYSGLGDNFFNNIGYYLYTNCLFEFMILGMMLFICLICIMRLLKR